MSEHEFEKEAKALLRNCPETYDEILSGRVGNRRREKDFQAKTGQEAVIVSIGEKQREHINMFAVKLTVATFYQISGRILTDEEAITVFVHTSANVVDGTFPEMLSILGGYRTMRQGNWSVESQFAYR
ncbi:hypothetical protein ATY81_12180 [Rhizobium sp. R72]|uniref:hypothetical protein n=1 Tax=unclassified Rhizobium TaxID=2613769 RepID=UPI000B529801|nr:MULTISPECIES: hypothetical protein [unclassified Rhizobium]OWV94207.1 hypothetical protein ATY81_12180 [Rhizobium sp. R72]OWV94477.1 hypothetical protein ATY80_12180 [Rhizobium sp. R711]OWV99028.1 hypothetical protein ATY79_17665 [Rhizobium sp. R693]